MGRCCGFAINQGLSTHHAQPGEVFDGTVLNDVVADGAVAIPRGASVQGTVVDAKSAGALKGRGELALQLTRLTMGGQSYAIDSDVWKRNGADKTTHTVNSAVGYGAFGRDHWGGGRWWTGSGDWRGCWRRGGCGIFGGVAERERDCSGGGCADVSADAADDGGDGVGAGDGAAIVCGWAGTGAPRPVVVRPRYAPYPYYGPYGPYYGPRY